MKMNTGRFELILTAARKTIRNWNHLMGYSIMQEGKNIKKKQRVILMQKTIHYDSFLKISLS